MNTIISNNSRIDEISHKVEHAIQKSGIKVSSFLAKSFLSIYFDQKQNICLFDYHRLDQHNKALFIELLSIDLVEANREEIEILDNLANLCKKHK